MDSSLFEDYFLYEILFGNDLDDLNSLFLRKNTALIALYVMQRHQSKNSGNQRQRKKRVRGNYLTRPDLLPLPRVESAWLAMYRSKEDRAYINTMGVDVDTFNFLLEAGFKHAWDTRPIPRNDVDPAGATRMGKRSLDAPGALGLLLHFLTSTMNETGLQLIFAIVPSTLSRYIHFAMSILLEVLKTLPEAEIRWPSSESMDFYSDLIQERHPLIDGAFGFVDGLNLPVTTSSDPLVENAMYNGWLHAHMVSNVIAFAPDGTIISARVNCPGSWHDSKVAQPIYEQLIHHTPPGFFLIADTAFPKLGQGINQKIKTPLKAGTRIRGNRRQRRAKIAYSNAITSARQAVEWGMRAIQGCFARLRVPMDVNDPAGRMRLLETCMRLHNVRTRMIGINQIRSVYMPVWTQGQEDFFDRLYSVMFPQTRRNDRIGRYYIDIEED